MSESKTLLVVYDNGQNEYHSIGFDETELLGAIRECMYGASAGMLMIRDDSESTIQLRVINLNKVQSMTLIDKSPAEILQETQGITTEQPVEGEEA